MTKYNDVRNGRITEILKMTYNRVRRIVVDAFMNGDKISCTDNRCFHRAGEDEQEEHTQTARRKCETGRRARPARIRKRRRPRDARQAKRHVRRDGYGEKRKGPGGEEAAEVANHR